MVVVILVLGSSFLNILDLTIILYSISFQDPTSQFNIRPLKHHRFPESLSNVPGSLALPSARMKLLGLAFDIGPLSFYQEGSPWFLASRSVGLGCFSGFIHQKDDNYP